MSAQLVGRIALVAGRVLLALLFLMTGGHKLVGDAMMVTMFNRIGFAQNFRYFTGVLEVACALLVLWPRSSFYAATLMTCIMLGAFAVQAFILHGDVIHTIVIGGATATLAWVQRPRPARPAQPVMST